MAEQAEQVEDSKVEDSQIEDAPDEQLLEMADVLGVEAEDYGTGKELESACWQAAKEQASELKVKDSKVEDSEPSNLQPEKLAIEAYKVSLKSDDFDEKLINELNHLSKTQTERFTGALEQLLKTQTVQMQDVRKELEHVTAIARQATRNDDIAAFDRWINRTDDAREFLGEGDTEDLDEDKFSRRRDRVLKKAYSIHAKAREAGKTPPSRSKLFAKALNSVRPSKVTRTARAGGASADSTVQSVPVSDKERFAKAGRTAEKKWQEIYGNRS